jgi:hypothetical protein
MIRHQVMDNPRMYTFYVCPTVIVSDNEKELIQVIDRMMRGVATNSDVRKAIPGHIAVYTGKPEGQSYISFRPEFDPEGKPYAKQFKSQDEAIQFDVKKGVLEKQHDSYLVQVGFDLYSETVLAEGEIRPPSRERTYNLFALDEGDNCATLIGRTFAYNHRERGVVARAHINPLDMMHEILFYLLEDGASSKRDELTNAVIKSELRRDLIAYSTMDRIRSTRPKAQSSASSSDNDVPTGGLKPK